jgi:hypothetical protein
MNGMTVTVPVMVDWVNFDVPEDGHYHLWVDGTQVRAAAMTTMTMVELGVGHHVITAELRTPDHVVLGAMDKVEVDVRLPYASIMVMKDASTHDTHDAKCEMGDEHMADAHVGDMVTYCYWIKNTGEITLTHHTLVDDKLGMLEDNVAEMLAPGQMITHTAMATMTEYGVLSNTAVVTATNGDYMATGWATAYVHVPPLLNLTAMTDTIQVGESYTVSVWLEGAVDEMVNSFEFMLNYDPAVLSATGAMISQDFRTMTGTVGSAAPGTPQIHVDHGDVYFAGYFANGEWMGTDKGKLAYVYFQGIATGTTTVALSNTLLGASWCVAFVPFGE